MKSDSAVHLAHDPVLLPHQHLPEDIAELFPEAIPDSPRQDEDDGDPVEELSDPVPALQALRRSVPAADADWGAMAIGLQRVAAAAVVFEPEPDAVGFLEARHIHLLWRDVKVVFDVLGF